MKYIKTIITPLTLAGIFIVAWQFVLASEIESPQIYPLNILLEEKNTPITLIAVGDIMLSRDVEQKMIQKNDWVYPFRETYQVTTAGDIVFGNLETPIIEGPAVPTGRMRFRADPRSVEGLKFGGFNVLSLANNHLKNYGDEGIKKTMEYLDEVDIAHTGAGLNINEARQPATIKVQGKKFGFLAYVDSSFTPKSYEATETKSGSPFLNKQTLIEDINNLKDKVDIIIVSMHAGTEYTNKPNQKQTNFAHTAIDNGAALVLGHHPHIVQPVEQYNNGYIIYSLGNFIFDQMWSATTRESVIATITFKNELIESINFTPIKIYDFSQPRVLTVEEGQHIIDRITNFTF